MASSAPDASLFLPARRDDLDALRSASTVCRGCGLYERATQTVFGSGRRGAKVMFVGEQPGEREDRDGRPFVGPAGQVLDSALSEAGIDRVDAYVTNAVKHFKWEARGKVRLHKKPSSREVTACKPWLLAEIETVGPELLVCLGATAALALLGPTMRVTQHRGEVVGSSIGKPALVTVHPSSILRERDPGARELAFAAFVDDLAVVPRQLSEMG